MRSNNAIIIFIFASFFEKMKVVKTNEMTKHLEIKRRRHFSTHYKHSPKGNEKMIIKIAEEENLLKINNAKNVCEESRNFVRFW